jgi:hypothetical protein
MTMMLSLFGAGPRDDKAANLVAAAKALSPILSKSRPLDRRTVADIMAMSFNGTDAEGAWIWKGRLRRHGSGAGSAAAAPGPADQSSGGRSGGHLRPGLGAYAPDPHPDPTF